MLFRPILWRFSGGVGVCELSFHTLQKISGLCLFMPFLFLVCKQNKEMIQEMQ